jgi:aminopeptidase N
MAQERTRFRTGWVTFANEVKAQARRQDQFVTTHPIAADIPDTLSTRVMFDAISYSKGASVLRQLVAWVGGEPFFEGVRTYFRRHEYANTELTDFLTALEQASGRDLKSWSKEWIETAGLNTIAADFETRDGKFSSFALVQQAPPEHPILRSHRLEVGLYDSADDGVVLRRRIELDVAGDRTDVPDLVGEPAADLVLPNDGDLAYVKVRFDSMSLDTIRRRLKMIRDPLARSMCWSAAWEMLQDGDFAASDYLEVVLNNLGEEADTRVIQNIVDKPRSTLSGIVYLLLGRVKAAIDLFGDPAKRTKAIDAYAAFLERSATEAESGSDRQLIFARAFVSAARSSDHLEVARGLLDDSSRFEGLEVGPDLRWLIVRSLAALGTASEELIASELARDPTDEGERMASRARAAFPTAEAKAKAWEAITRDESLSRTAMVDLIAGLQQTGQEELLRPYFKKYFAVLSEFWESRSAEVTQAFAVYAYPHFIVEEGTLAATDEYLDSSDPPPPLRRLLLESRDGVVRALEGRRRDSS